MREKKDCFLSCLKPQRHQRIYRILGLKLFLFQCPEQNETSYEDCIVCVFVFIVFFNERKNTRQYYSSIIKET